MALCKQIFETVEPETDPWNHFAPEFVDWQTYSQGRPHVPTSFWQRFADYHREHGSDAFGTVHDLGSGPGIHADALAKHFTSVTLTDPNAENIEKAQAMLSVKSDPGRFVCRVGRGEDPSESPEMYDMVTVINSIHWMDPINLMQNISHSLKPGGTVAIAIFGFPDVVDVEAKAALRSWFRKGVDAIMSQEHPALMPYSIALQDGRYAGIGMSSTLWSNITRVVLNEKLTTPVGLITDAVAKALDRDLWAVNPSETIAEENAREWHARTDLKGLRNLLYSYSFPHVEETDKSLWDELGRIYESKPVDIAWSVSIILATKK